MKKIFSLFIIFSSICHIFAQSNPISEYVDKYSNVVPLTPNGASFTTYGNTGVNYSKGIPNISIPIHTISIDGVSVPISISYDATGIKVNDMASVVGLKWRLNAGGGIFRSINNEPDESGWTTQNNTSLDTQWYYDHPISISGHQTYLMNNAIDHSPDHFSYNFGSYFGSFIFKRKDINTILKNKNDNLLITKGNPFLQLLESFVAKDVNGNTYNFGGTPNTKETNSNTTINGFGNSISGSAQDYVSSWLLKNITSKNNRQLNFDYIDYNMYYTLFHRSQNIKKENDNINAAFTKSTISTINRPKNKLISKIASTNEEVNFIYENHTPSNIPQGNNIWGKKLTRIEIKNKITQEIIKIVNFIYETYNGDPRLKLKEVNEENPLNGDIKSSYSFNYNDNYSLPNKKSYSRDYFGYYNGAQNPSLLIPFSSQAYAKLPLLYKKQLADRRPYFDYLVSGNLEEIIYPTGGKTKFEYELNVEDNGLGEYKYIEDEVTIDAQEAGYQILNNQRVFTKPFSIPQHVLANATINNPNVIVESINNILSCNDPNFPNIDCAKYSIYERTENLMGNMVGQKKIVGYNGITTIAPGNYFLVLEVDESNYTSNPNLQLNVNFKWVYNIEDANGTLIREPHYAGGLRIKSIVDENIDNIEYNKTTFEYSGLKGQLWKEDFVNTNDIYWTTSSEFLIHNSLFKAGHYYEEVTTKKGGGEDVYEQRLVFEPDYDNYSHKAKQSKIFSYDKDNRLLNKVFYVYETSTTTNSYNILGKLNYPYNYDSVTIRIGYNWPQNVNYTEFESRLINNISTQYFYVQDSNTVSGSITNASYFQYNSDELISEKVENSKLKENQNIDYFDQANYSSNLNSRKIVTNYTFPKNYVNEPVFQDLINNKNLLSIPVSIIVSENGEKLQGSFLEYDTKGNIKNLFSYNKGKGSNNSNINYIPDNYELNSSYIFDNFGNTIEVSKTEGTSASYIWGYNHQYPVAKIENATYAQIEALSSFGTGFSLGANGLTASQESQLRSLTNAQVTTYKYKPLVGVISTTDPRGYTTYYEYDAFNRLEYIKDADGNILSKNDYNYANQN